MIFIYGDSNSVQWTDTPNPGRPWTSRFGTRLVGDAAAPTVFVSRALGGQRMHLCRGQVVVPGVSWPTIETYAVTDLTAAEARAALPTQVWVMAGTNDLDATTTPDAEMEDLMTSYTVLATTCHERWGIPMRVLSIPPMHIGGMMSQTNFNFREVRRKQVNQRNRTVFGPTGWFTDVDPVLVDVTGQLLTPFRYGDGLHINAQGHVAISDSLPLVTP